MEQYPEILLPRKSYPVLSGGEIASCAFVRETAIDLYPILRRNGFAPEDVVRHVVAPQPSLREVFELSVFLYGYYDELHVGIRVDDAALYQDWTESAPDIQTAAVAFTRQKAYPLFLRVEKLDKQEIDFNGEPYLLAFSHKPSRANYWHFQLWTRDSVGRCIPRDKSGARMKHLARSILEYIVAEAICAKDEVRRFQRDDFDRALNLRV